MPETPQDAPGRGRAGIHGKTTGRHTMLVSEALEAAHKARATRVVFRVIELPDINPPLRAVAETYPAPRESSVLVIVFPGDSLEVIRDRVAAVALARGWTDAEVAAIRADPRFHEPGTQANLFELP